MKNSRLYFTERSKISFLNFEASKVTYFTVITQNSKAGSAWLQWLDENCLKFPNAEIMKLGSY